MEIANLGVRPAEEVDGPAVTRLLRVAPLRHYHLDWFLPADWLGMRGFVLTEADRETSGNKIVNGCLAAIADPLPAAWVRLAAIRHRDEAGVLLAAMLESAVAELVNQGAVDLGWLAGEAWPERWLSDLGFEQVNSVETYVKLDLEMPALAPTEATVRPVEEADLPALVAIEARAFEPLWRHSQTGLQRAMPHTISFDVAEVNGRPVGFQYSTAGAGGGAHLTRLTVDPIWQRQGVGSLLLGAAITSYRDGAYDHASLNTQSDNEPSQFLYRKFGFQRAGDRIPVWLRRL